MNPYEVTSSGEFEARAVWDAGPPPLSDRDRWQFRYYAADALRDLADVETSDKERAVFLIGLILPTLINQHYRISGRWLYKPKKLFNDLENWDAIAARLARQACNDRVVPSDRCAAVRALADHVLAPLGGIMPIEWSTEWELLEPTDAKSNSAA